MIEPDAALERRFQPIRVQELTAAEARVVLVSPRDELARAQHVEVPDEVLDWLIDFAGEFLRNRTFPDKAVDLIEQCAAYAVTRADNGRSRRCPGRRTAVPTGPDPLVCGAR